MKKRSLGIALAAIALGAVTTVPAQADPLGNPIVELKNVAQNKCLATKDSDQWDGREVVLLPCDGSPEQRWERPSKGPGRSAVLRNVADGKCAVGWSLLGPWYCDDERADTIVSIEGTGTGSYRLKYPDGYAASPYYNDHSVSLSSYADDDRQRWTMRTVGQTTPGDPTGKAVRFASPYGGGRCVGAAGLAIELMPCADVPEQWFQRIELGGGLVQLRNKDVCLSATANWVELELACDANDVSQKWRVEADSLNLSTVRSAVHGKVLSNPSPGSNYISLSEPHKGYRYSESYEVTVR